MNGLDNTKNLATRASWQQGWLLVLLAAADGSSVRRAEG